MVADASRHPMSDLAGYSTPHRLAAAEHDAAGLTLRWSDGQRSRLHAIWLRDQCACPECRHPRALERTYAFIDHPAPVLDAARIDASGDLEVSFRQGTRTHSSHFTRGWLRAQTLPDSRADAARQLWDGDIARRLCRIDYSRYIETAPGLHAWISSIKRDGIVLLRGVPVVPGHLLEVARRIGPVRGSNFGELYDVVLMANPNASAYTDLGLELHTDLANWRSPPDIQLLHCLKSSVTGGESVFADGFAVAEALRRADPAAFELLATQPLEFRFHDEHCDIRASAPVIEIGRDGRPGRIRFNNWLRGATVFPPHIVDGMYAALGTFWRLLREPRYQLELRLEPGDLIGYDNARVLHGRASFDASSGERHLQGCYLNQEDLDSTLRVLERPAR